MRIQTTSFRRIVGAYCNQSTEPKGKDERGKLAKLTSPSLWREAWEEGRPVSSSQGSPVSGLIGPPRYRLRLCPWLLGMASGAQESPAYQA